MKESKEEKFKRLAQKRVPVALEKIRLVGNLGNKNLYTYSDSDIKKIISALKESVKDCEDSLKGKKKKEFTL
jgi:hypothetical protein